MFLRFFWEVVFQGSCTEVDSLFMWNRTGQGLEHWWIFLQLKAFYLVSASPAQQESPWGSRVLGISRNESLIALLNVEEAADILCISDYARHQSQVCKVSAAFANGIDRPRPHLASLGLVLTKSFCFQVFLLGWSEGNCRVRSPGFLASHLVLLFQDSQLLERHLKSREGLFKVNRSDLNAKGEDPVGRESKSICDCL